MSELFVSPIKVRVVSNRQQLGEILINRIVERYTSVSTFISTLFSFDD